MNEKPTYDFASHEEVMQAIHAHFELSKDGQKIQRETLERAIDAFLRTRLNHELIDIFDIDTEQYGSIYDTGSLYLDKVYDEVDRRNIPHDEKIRYLLNQWYPEWVGGDEKALLTRFENMEKRVAGIQKKLDKIVQLLENFEIKMSVKDALSL